MVQKEPHNVDVFNRVVSKVLADLYQSFPNPRDIDPSQVGAAIVDDDGGYDDMFVAMHETAANTIQYLLDQGLVAQANHQKIWDGPRFKSVLLTENGLRLLDAVPESVDPQRDDRTLADRLIDSAANGKWAISSTAARSAPRPGLPGRCSRRRGG